MSNWSNVPFPWILGLLSLLFSATFFTNGNNTLGVLLLLLTIVLFALGFYTIYRYVQKYGVEKDNSKNQVAQNSNFTQTSLQKTASKPHQQEPNCINQQHQNSVYNTILEKNISANEHSIEFCRKCGNRLSEDSFFCNKCGTKREDRSLHQTETFKILHPKVEPTSIAEISIEDYRKKHIAKALITLQKKLESLHIYEEYVKTVDKVVFTINNDLLVYESFFGKRLYLDAPPQFQKILDNIPNKAVGIAIYESLLKSYFEEMRPGDIIGHICDVLLFEFSSESTKIFDMNKEELKDFLIKKVNQKLTQTIR